VQFLRYDEAQHPVAQKLEALVGALGVRARMGERTPQQILVLEGMAKAALKLGRIRRCLPSR